MFQLILVVVILIALTYMWSSTKAAGKFKAFGKDNPFKGRFKEPPPRPPHHTIDKGNMTRCHNCSCFFPENQVIHEVVEGHILEFCSEACKRNFHAPRK